MDVSSIVETKVEDDGDGDDAAEVEAFFVPRRAVRFYCCRGLTKLLTPLLEPQEQMLSVFSSLLRAIFTASVLPEPLCHGR